MATTANFTLADGDGQPSTTGYYLEGEVDDVEDSLVEALGDAINGMSDSKLLTVNLLVSDYVEIGAAASNPYNIADKAVVEWRDEAGQEGSFAIPCPDDDAFGADNETVDISAGAGATLKVAIETLVKGPSGEAVAVRKITRWRFTRQP